MAPSNAEVTSKSLNIIIIGGSCGGLMAGILLRRAGHNVRILERTATNGREGLAAGIGFQSDVKRFFDTQDRLSEKPFGVSGDGLVFLDQQLRQVSRMPLKLIVTSWDATYYRLRANFDGLTSVYCPESLSSNEHETEGEGVYCTGMEVVGVEDSDAQMIAVAKNIATGETERFRGDLVIAADGANSSIRRMLSPCLQRYQPGYLIWRGTVREGELSRSTRELLSDKVIIHPGRYNYCVVYTIPGENGTLRPGDRHLNFAWYFWPSNPTISDIMTDVDGHEHRTTIPKGKLRPEIWQAQLAQAKKLFPDALVEAAEKIRQPFVSIISSIASPKAAYFNRRLLLLGDALNQSQPNSGMGTSMAARGALLLAEAIGPSTAGGHIDQMKIAAWEKRMLADNKLTRFHARAWASWYLCSWPMIGWHYSQLWALRFWYRYVVGN